MICISGIRLINRDANLPFVNFQSDYIMVQEGRRRTQAVYLSVSARRTDQNRSALFEIYA